MRKKLVKILTPNTKISIKEYNDEKYVICENYREIDLALGK